jgi:hypothetical protein
MAWTSSKELLTEDVRRGEIPTLLLYIYFTSLLYLRRINLFEGKVTVTFESSQKNWQLFAFNKMLHSEYRSRC